MSGVEFQLVKIQTCILKVHIHCEGCARKVKKVLKGIEGVYEVDMNVEEQKVIVCGIVDSATLIRKLKKSRKHAEIWSPIQTGNQSLQALNNWITDGQDLINDTSNNRSIMDPTFGHGEQYVNEIEEIESLMDANNCNFRASSIENQETLVWDGTNIRSLKSYQDLANGAGGFEGFVGLPVYPPALRMNSTQEYLSHHPFPVMENSIIPDFGAAIPNMMVHSNGYKYMHQPPHIYSWMPTLIGFHPLPIIPEEHNQ